MFIASCELLTCLRKFRAFCSLSQLVTVFDDADLIQTKAMRVADRSDRLASYAINKQ